MIAEAADDGDERPCRRRRHPPRSEFEEREWQLVRACALGELDELVAGWLWWSLNQQATTWRWN